MYVSAFDLECNEEDFDKEPIDEGITTMMCPV
uniref:Uncharacterized protein n=1 Tax=Arundo donax TaxID=35708 RepID=A0A0A9B7K5_ARUDO